METLSVLLALCERAIHRSPVDSPHKRPIVWSFDAFFDVHLNKQLNKQWSCRWFETLWHYNDFMSKLPSTQHIHGVNVITQNAQERLFSNLAHTLVMIVHLVDWLFKVMSQSSKAQCKKKWRVRTYLFLIWFVLKMDISIQTHDHLDTPHKCSLLLLRTVVAVNLFSVCVGTDVTVAWVGWLVDAASSITGTTGSGLFGKSRCWATSVFI